MYAFKQESPIIFEPPTPKLHLAALQAWGLQPRSPLHLGESQQGGGLWQLPLCSQPRIEPLLPTPTTIWRHQLLRITNRIKCLYSRLFFLNLLVTLKKRFILVNLQYGAVLRHKEGIGFIGDIPFTLFLHVTLKTSSKVITLFHCSLLLL